MKEGKVLLKEDRVLLRVHKMAVTKAIHSVVINIPAAKVHHLLIHLPAAAHPPVVVRTTRVVRKVKPIGEISLVVAQWKAKTSDMETRDVEAVVVRKAAQAAVLLHHVAAETPADQVVPHRAGGVTAGATAVVKGIGAINSAVAM